MNNTSLPATQTATALQTANHGVAPLLGTQASPDSDWGLVRVHGADSTSFLHNQLTQDVTHMGINDARLAAWCSAKGRIIASFVLLRDQRAGVDEPAYWLLCRRSVVPQFVRRLKMFVLRSKVLIEDATDSMAAYGLLGEAARGAWQAHGAAWPDSAWRCLSVQEGEHARHLVSLYPATVSAVADAAATVSIPRVLCLQSPELPAPDGATLPLACWEWSEVTSGVASIGQACSELFVPQMINFESVDGVNFKKGCYPGQEVVARSQFRGTIKRRGYIATAYSPFPDTAQALAGQEVWFVPAPNAEDAAGGPEPCGTIVQAACLGEHCAFFASLATSTAEAALAEKGYLHLGSDAGVRLQLHPLPYLLIEV